MAGLSPRGVAHDRGHHDTCRSGDCSANTATAPFGCGFPSTANEIETGFARHASRPAVGMVVRVVTDEPVTATVTLTVDQSQHSESFVQNTTCPCPWSKDCRCF